MQTLFGDVNETPQMKFATGCDLILEKYSILIWQDLKQPQPDVQPHQMIASVQNAATGITAIYEQIENLYAIGDMQVEFAGHSVKCQVVLR